jgi:hypothetical protein
MKALANKKVEAEEAYKMVSDMYPDRIDSDKGTDNIKKEMEKVPPMEAHICSTSNSHVYHARWLRVCRWCTRAWHLHRQTMTPRTAQKKRILAEKQGEQRKDVRKIEMAYLKAHKEMTDQSNKAEANVGHAIHPRVKRASNPISVFYDVPLNVLQCIYEMKHSFVHGGVAT